MSLISRRNGTPGQPPPDEAQRRFVLDVDAFDGEPEHSGDGHGTFPLAEDLYEQAPEFEDLSDEFATTEDQIYFGVPFVGKVVRYRDNKPSFVDVFTVDEPGNIKEFRRRNRGGGEYELHTRVTGQETVIRFFLDGDEADEKPAKPARSHAAPTYDAEIEEKAEARGRKQGQREAERAFQAEREAWDADRARMRTEVRNAIEDRDRAERRTRELQDSNATLNETLADLRGKNAELSANADLRAAEARREAAEDSQKREAKHYRDMQALRDELAEARGEVKVLELEMRLGSGKEPGFARDFVKLLIENGVVENVVDGFKTLATMPGFATLDDGFALPEQLAGAPDQTLFPSSAAPDVQTAMTGTRERREEAPIPVAPGGAQQSPEIGTGALALGGDAGGAGTPSTLPTMIDDLLSTALDALTQRLDMEPARFVQFLDEQRALADEHGINLGTFAGPLLLGITQDAAAQAVAPERVAEYVMPTIERLAPTVGPMLSFGPTSMIAKTVCAYAQTSLSPTQMGYLESVLDACRRIKNN